MTQITRTGASLLLAALVFAAPVAFASEVSGTLSTQGKSAPTKTGAVSQSQSGNSPSTLSGTVSSPSPSNGGGGALQASGNGQTVSGSVLGASSFPEGNAAAIDKNGNLASASPANATPGTNNVSGGGLSDSGTGLAPWIGGGIFGLMLIGFGYFLYYREMNRVRMPTA